MNVLTEEISIAVCIPTRNRPTRLDACLKSIWASTTKPQLVIVSDDSADESLRAKNRAIVSCYPDTEYSIGPQLGVTSNRNNALCQVRDVTHVSFVDDDILIDKDLIFNAVKRYKNLPKEKRNVVILSGSSRTPNGGVSSPVKLNFRGYFCHSEQPESAECKASFFPKKFFCEEKWDENIFFGYEDAELCLRAIRNGYQLQYCSELQAVDTGACSGTLSEVNYGGLTDYEIYVEASRLYVGIKRYGEIFPSKIRLIAFITFFFVHMSVYLLRRQSISLLPEIIRRSNVKWDNISFL